MIPERPHETAVPGSFPVALRDLALAFSLANLCLIPAWFSMLYDADFGYYNKQRVGPAALLALLANFTVLTGVFWVAGQWVRRTRFGWVKVVGHLAPVVVLLVPIDFLRFNVLVIADQRVANWILHPLGLTVLFIGGVASLYWHRTTARLGAAIGLIMVPLGVWVLGRLVLVLLGVVPLAQAAESAAAKAPQVQPKSGVRVLWLIFDEMDQRLTFDARPAGLRLPELEGLRREGLYAANAYPPGGSTMVSMPALTTGLPVVAARPCGPSEVRLTLAGQDAAFFWGQQSNVFGRALDLGFNTALVGWFHPYARVLGRTLTFCEWFPFPRYEPAMARTFLGCLGQQLLAMFGPWNLRRLHVEMYRDSLRHALESVGNTNYGLVLLHFSVPHKPGIYLRDEGRLTPGGVPQPHGYFNNLALVDRTLGELLARLRASGSADRTWVILSSDHWWRESAVADGKVDQRVPFILKAPESSASIRYEPGLDTGITADLILAILRGELGGLAAVVPWLDHHRRMPRTDLSGRDDEE